MKALPIVVSLEHKFYRVNGDVYTGLAFSYEYWSSYLNCFDSVLVFARVQECDTKESHFVLASGPRVKFLPCPHYHGPIAFFLNLPKMLSVSYSISKNNELFLLRSGNVSNSLWVWLFMKRKNYIFEFPGDMKNSIKEFYQPKSRVLKIFVAITSSILASIGRLQAQKALACSYVSDATRSIYPAKNKEVEYVFSSVVLPPDSVQKSSYKIGSTVLIAALGRLEREKGHVYLLAAVDVLSNIFPKLGFKISLIGDGSRLEELRDFSRRMKFEVEFVGTVTDKSLIFEKLTDADIFVLPSLSEGMPRALIEAIALGVPSLASSVGGVPEILGPDHMFLPKSPDDIAHAMAKVISQPERERSTYSQLERMKIHKSYSSERMSEIKKQFWTSFIN